MPASMYVKPAMVQLWIQIAEDDLLYPAGTGTLVTYGNRQFLITAAHNIARKNVRGVIVGAKIAFKIDKPFRRNVPVHSIDYDQIDFAAVELTYQQSLLLMESSRFLALDLDTPHVPPFHRKFAKLFGFIQSKNARKGNVLSSDAQTTEAELCFKHLRTERLMPFKDCLIGAVVDLRDKNWINSPGFETLRDYSGFSGGPWFYSEPFLQVAYLEFAGITLESVGTGRDGVLRFFGLNTRAIIEMMYVLYPDLAPPANSTKDPLGLKNVL